MKLPEAGRKSQKIKELKKEQMDGMEKAIVFVGGMRDGVDRFERFLKSNYRVKNVNVRNNFGKMLPEKFELSSFDTETFEQIENAIIQCEDFDYETLATGESIRNFLASTAEVLVLHDSSESARKYMAKIDRLNIYRVFFGYKDDLPSEFDFNVNPNKDDFEEIVCRIINDEERISWEKDMSN